MKQKPTFEKLYSCWCTWITQRSQAQEKEDKQLEKVCNLYIDRIEKDLLNPKSFSNLPDPERIRLEEIIKSVRKLSEETIKSTARLLKNYDEAKSKAN